MFQPLANQQIQLDYDHARNQYLALGIDTDAALDTLAKVPISLHCWQGDDVRGFEVHDAALDGGGIMATGNYPGAATDGSMLRQDAEKAFALIPGKKRFNLHAIYAETDGQTVDRDEIEPRHFQYWLEWSRRNNIPLDFNPTFFAHPLANDGYTLAHADDQIRNFWIRHGKACRRIAEAMGKNQGTPCLVNHWMPDGAKDHPMDRYNPRLRMLGALDEIFSEPIDPAYCKDAVECKLFGIGSEDYVVGSHEFFLGYTMTRPQIPCLDMGHFHPTETIHDKISALFCFKEEILLHVSRGVRWDSDHVVIFNDDLAYLFQQIVRDGFLPRTNIALDFFDASINRIGAWVIGTRATQKALLQALLEPTDKLRHLEQQGNGAAKLALLEELKTFPLGAVWNMYCYQQQTPVGIEWINEMNKYDQEVVRSR